MEGCSNAPQNDPEEMIKATVAYMSPSQILKLPKAGERRISYVNRKIDKTVILADTPVRDESAEKDLKTAKSNASQKVRRTLSLSGSKSSKKVKRTKVPEDVSTDSSDDESSVKYNDTSEDEIDTEEDIIEGDFVVVMVKGKSRSLNYIARVDICMDVVAFGGTSANANLLEYEGTFLKRLPTKDESEVIFTISDCCSSFVKEDILTKLPTPKVAGESVCRGTQVKFETNLSRWNLAR